MIRDAALAVVSMAGLAATAAAITLLVLYVRACRTPESRED